MRRVVTRSRVIRVYHLGSEIRLLRMRARLGLQTLACKHITCNVFKLRALTLTTIACSSQFSTMSNSNLAVRELIKNFISVKLTPGKGINMKSQLRT